MRSPISLRRRKQITIFSTGLAVVLLTMLAVSYQQTEESARHSRGSAQSRVGLLALDTSDPNLAAAFGWARRQSLAYSFIGDLVGDWDEAALPRRQAFSMRSWSH